MKIRRTTLSLMCCLGILILVYFCVDIQIQPQSTNTHIHIYYSLTTNTGPLDSHNDQKIKYVNIFNQSSIHNHNHLLQHDYLTTTDVYYDDNNVTESQPDIPTTVGSMPRSNAHIVAIVSYMRSGSTLTADIMQHFPGAMYVFEPFHSLALRARKHLSLFYLNGAVRKLKSENITDDLLRSELQKWFECRFKELDVHSLSDNFHMHYSRTMKKFYQCWRPKPRTVRTLQECLPIAIDMCKKAKYRIFKFIRLPMRVVKSVFDIYPKLQVVHLIRDPRGSLSSQIKVNTSTWGQIGITSQHFCDRVADDISSTLQLHSFHPDRAKMLLYENLAENPLETAGKLYNFTHMPHYEYVTKYITRLTMGGRRSHNDFGSLRENSTKTAYKWRDNIKFEHVETIDKHCRSVYDFVGYQRLKSVTDVRNHYLPTLKTPNTTLII